MRVSATTHLPLPDDAQLGAAIAEWLPAQRWFAAKHHTVGPVRIEQRFPIIDEADFCAEHLVAAVGSVRYQIPVGHRTRLAESYSDAGLPVPPGSSADAVYLPITYDGLRDPEIATLYFNGMTDGRMLGPLRFHRVDRLIPQQIRPAKAGETVPSRVLSVEQSNTSVVFGEEPAAAGEAVLIKFFRRLEPGINPDIELLSGLTRAACPHIVPLLGWLEATTGGSGPADGRCTLGMASSFVPNAADGWTMALTSVRDLLAEADLRADEVGTDFAGEAERLGAAVATVHTALAETFGVEDLPVAEAITPRLRAGLHSALAVVPQIEEYRTAIIAAYADADSVGTAAAHRIHGDLHLGQVLRSPQRWLLVDFEGEPMRPLAERRAPDSPLRDVAGMLRSFDYAGHQGLGDPSLPNAAQRRFRASEWVDRNTSAFGAGYAGAGNRDPNAHAALLRAYLLDKAVYEAAYEARNRPDWLHLPLRAIAELAKG
ncbi:MAG: hypothetical protein HOQ24_19830 [Mycobacteriaceae bacterium]|nr:hypothetical protein [Mycobacteriaceae bacterium]